MGKTGLSQAGTDHLRAAARRRSGGPRPRSSVMSEHQHRHRHRGPHRHPAPGEPAAHGDQRGRPGSGNLQAALALTVVLALACVGVLTYLASGEASDAQEQVDPAQTQTAAPGEVALLHVRHTTSCLRAQVDLAKAQLTQAMGQEVRYSFVLRDLEPDHPPLRSTLTQLTDTNRSLPEHGHWRGGAERGSPASPSAVRPGRSARWRLARGSLTKEQMLQRPVNVTAVAPTSEVEPQCRSSSTSRSFVTSKASDQPVPGVKGG